MADSKRQKLVDAVIERMRTIKTANGYETNLGENVWEWRINFDETELEPYGALSVCDLPADAVNRVENVSDARETIWLMPFQIRFFFKQGFTPKDVRKGLQDVQKAIRQDDRWKVGNIGLAMTSRPQKEGFLIPENSFEIVGGVIEFEAQVFTHKFNAEE